MASKDFLDSRLTGTERAEDDYMTQAHELGVIHREQVGARDVEGQREMRPRAW